MAFEEVKARLVADPVLACPDFNRTFILNGRREKLFNNGEGVLDNC